MATLYVFADEAAKDAAINDGSGTYTAENTFSSIGDAVRAASISEENTICVGAGTYSDSIAFVNDDFVISDSAKSARRFVKEYADLIENADTVRAGEQKGDIKFVATEEGVVFTGQFALGYTFQGCPGDSISSWESGVSFEGITFESANQKTSITLAMVKDFSVKSCEFKGNGEFALDGVTNGDVPDAVLVEKCKFEKTGIQTIGGMGTNMVITGCEFIDSPVNATGGAENGVSIEKCTFDMTLSDSNVGDSFYVVRNSTASAPVNIKECTLTINSDLTDVAVGQEKWGLLYLRGTNWNVDGVDVTLSEDAQKQTDLLFVKNVASKYEVEVSNINSNVADLFGKTSGTVKVVETNAEGEVVSTSTYKDGALESVVAADEVLYLNGESYTADLEYKIITANSGKNTFDGNDVSAKNVYVGYSSDEAADLALVNGAHVNAAIRIVVGNDSELTVDADSMVATQSDCLQVCGTAIFDGGLAEDQKVSQELVASEKVQGKLNYLQVYPTGDMQLVNGAAVSTKAHVDVYNKLSIDNSRFETASQEGKWLSGTHTNHYGGFYIRENSVVSVSNGGLLAIGGEYRGKGNALYNEGTLEIKNGAQTVVSFNAVNAKDIKVSNGGVLKVGANFIADTTFNDFSLVNNGTIEVAGGIVEAGTVTNEDTFKVTGSEASTVKATITGNALQLENGVLENSEIDGKIRVYGNSVIQGSANEYDGDELVKDNSTKLGIVEINFENTKVNGYRPSYSETPVTLTIQGTNITTSTVYVGNDTVPADNPDYVAGTLKVIGDNDKSTVDLTTGNVYNRINGYIEISEANVVMTQLQNYGEVLVKSGSVLDLTHADSFTVCSKDDTTVANDCAVLTVDGATVLGGKMYIGQEASGGSSETATAVGSGKVVLSNGASLNLKNNLWMLKEDDKFDVSMEVSSDSTLTVGGKLFMGSGSSVTVDVAGIKDVASITAGSLAGDGTITVNVADDFSGIYKVIELSGTESLKDRNIVDVKAADNVSVVYGDDGDVTLVKVDTATLYVDSSLTGSEIGEEVEIEGVEETLAYGFNAFASINDAIKAAEKNGGAMIDLTTSKFSGSEAGLANANLFQTNGTYTFTGGDYIDFAYVDTPRPTEENAGKVSVNIVFDKAKVTAGKFRLDNGSSLEIKDSYIDAQSAGGGSSTGWTTFYGDSTITVENSVIGWFTTRQTMESDEIVAGDQKTNYLETNGLYVGRMCYCGSGVMTVTNSTVFTYPNEGDAFSLAVYDKGLMSFTNSAVYAYSLAVGGAGNKTVGRDDEVATMSFENSTLRTTTTNGTSTERIVVGGANEAELIFNNSTVEKSAAAMTVENNGIVDISYNSIFNTAKITNAGEVSVAGSSLDVDTLENNGEGSVVIKKYEVLDEEGNVIEVISSNAEFGTVTNAENATIEVSDSTFTADTVTNNGTFTVSGESTLNIGELTGGSITALDGAVLTDSIIASTTSQQLVVGEGGYNATVTFKGDNEIGKIAAFSGSSIIVGQDGSLKLTANRSGFGNGATWDIDGNIENAKDITDEQKADLKVSLNLVNGLSMSTTNGDDSVMNIDNAYVVFGNAVTSKNTNSYGGTFDINVTNSIIDAANNFGVYSPTAENSPVYDIDFKDSVLNFNSNLLNADKNSSMTFDNSKVTVKSSFRNDGTFELLNKSDMTVEAYIQESSGNAGMFGSVLIDDSKLTIKNSTEGHKTINRGSIELTNAASFTADYVENDSDATISVASSNLTVTNLTNNGTIKITGDSTLNIVTSEGKAIELAGTLVYSTIGGEVGVEASAEGGFAGENKVYSAMFYDGADITVKEGADVDVTATLATYDGASLNVEKNAEIDAQSIYFNGGSIEVSGKLSAKNNNDGGFILNGADDTVTINAGGVLDVNYVDAYKSTGNSTVELYGEAKTSFKLSDGQGKFTWNVYDGGSLTAEKYGIVMNNAESAINVYGDATASQISNAGKITVDGGNFNVTGTLTNAGTITVSGESSLKIDSFSGNTIVVTGGSLTDSSVIGSAVAFTGDTTLAGGSFFSKIWVSGGEVTVADDLVTKVPYAGFFVIGGNENLNDHEKGFYQNFSSNEAGSLVINGSYTAEEGVVGNDGALVVNGSMTSPCLYVRGGEVTINKDGNLSDIVWFGIENGGKVNVNAGGQLTTKLADGMGNTVISDGTLSVAGTANMSGITNSANGSLLVEGGSLTVNNLTNSAEFTVSSAVAEDGTETGSTVDIDKLANGMMLNVVINEAVTEDTTLTVKFYDTENDRTSSLAVVFKAGQKSVDAFIAAGTLLVDNKNYTYEVLDSNGAKLSAEENVEFLYNSSTLDVTGANKLTINDLDGRVVAKDATLLDGTVISEGEEGKGALILEGKEVNFAGDVQITGSVYSAADGNGKYEPDAFDAATTINILKDANVSFSRNDGHFSKDYYEWEGAFNLGAKDTLNVLGNLTVGKGNTYHKGTTIVEKDGMLHFNESGFQNTGSMTIKGQMEITDTVESGYQNIKLAGNEKIENGGKLDIDGGTLTINGPSFAFGGGYTSTPWSDSKYADVTVQNGGKLTANAKGFRNGKNSTMTLDNGTFELTEAGVFEGVHATVGLTVDNYGTIIAKNGSTLDFGDRVFTNAAEEENKGSISVDKSKFSVGAFSNQGSVSLTNGATLSVTGQFNNSGDITVDQSTTITANMFYNEGNLTFNITGDGVWLLIDTDDVNSNFGENITVNGGDNARYEIVKGDLYIVKTDATTMYFNSAWDGDMLEAFKGNTFADTVVDGKAVDIVEGTTAIKFYAGEGKYTDYAIDKDVVIETIDGEINMDVLTADAKLTVAEDTRFDMSGKLVVNADKSVAVDGKLVAGSVANNGTVVIGEDGFAEIGAIDSEGSFVIKVGEDFAGAKKVIDLAASENGYIWTNGVTVEGDAKAFYNNEGDVAVSNADMKNFVFNSAWETGIDFAENVEGEGTTGSYFGINAFDDVAAMGDQQKDADGMLLAEKLTFYAGDVKYTDLELNQKMTVESKANGEKTDVVMDNLTTTNKLTVAENGKFEMTGALKLNGENAVLDVAKGTAAKFGSIALNDEAVAVQNVAGTLNVTGNAEIRNMNIAGTGVVNVGSATVTANDEFKVEGKFTAGSMVIGDKNAENSTSVVISGTEKFVKVTGEVTVNGAAEVVVTDNAEFSFGTLVNNNVITVNNATLGNKESSIANNGSIVINGVSTVYASITGENGSVKLESGATLNGSLMVEDSSIEVGKNTVLGENATLEGLLLNGSISVKGDDNVLNITAGSTTTLIVDNTTKFDSLDKLGDILIKGASEDVTLTVADAALEGNTFDGVKLAITDLEDDKKIKADIELASIVSINGYALQVENGLFYYIDKNAGNKKMFVNREESNAGVSITITNSETDTTELEYEGKNFKVTEGSDDFANVKVIMQEGKTNFTVKNGKKDQYIEYAVGGIGKDENGGTNNVKFGNYTKVKVNGDIEAISNLTIGNKSVVTIGKPIYGDPNDANKVTGWTAGTGNIFGQNNNNTVKIGSDSKVTIAGNIDLAGGKNKLAIGARSDVEIGGNIDGATNFTVASGKKAKKDGSGADWTNVTITGNYVAAEMNNNLTIGNYVNFTLGQVRGVSIDNGGVSSGTGTKVKVGTESTMTVAGSANGIAGITTGKKSYVVFGAETKDAQGKVTGFTGTAIDGTDKNNKISVGAEATFKAGAIDLAGGKNNITTGKASEFVAGTIDNVQTIKVGSQSSFTTGDIVGVNKFTVGNGKAATKKAEAIITKVNVGKVTMTTGNDAFKVGNYSDVVVAGDIVFGAGKDTLTIGKDAKLTVNDITGMDKFNASKGAQLVINNGAKNDVDFDLVTGSWDKATIIDMEGDLAAGNINGNVYANELDCYDVTVEAGKKLTLSDIDGDEKVTYSKYDAVKEVWSDFKDYTKDMELSAGTYRIEVSVAGEYTDKLEKKSYSFTADLANA